MPDLNDWMMRREPHMIVSIGAMKTMNRDGCRFHCYHDIPCPQRFIGSHDFIVSIETVDTDDQYSSSITDMQEPVDWCSP